MEVLPNMMVVIILQHIRCQNQQIVHLNLIQRYMSITLIKLESKYTKNIVS